VGDQLFGRMDDIWRTIYLKICFYIRPARWTWADWIRIALGCGFAVWAASQCPDRRLARFWASVVASALIGLVGSLIAVNSHYLLLMQASPYRTLWLLELLAIPAGYGLAALLWQCGSQQSRSASLVVVLLLTLKWDSDLGVSASMILLSLLGFAVLCRGCDKIPRHSDWLWRSTQNAFLATSGLMLLSNLIQLTMFRTELSIDLESHPVLIAMHVSGILYSLPLLLICASGFIAVYRVAVQGFHLRFLLLTCCAGYQALLVCAPDSDWYGRTFDVRTPHVRFVDSRLANRAGGHGKPLSIYWPTPVEDVWISTGNYSYYNGVQMSGCGFNRGTAVEGYRRAALALPFEFERLKFLGDKNDWLIAFRDTFRIKGRVHFPRKEDLLCLCREKGLDFIVLKYRIQDLFCDSDGYYYIYDCEQLRGPESAVCLHAQECPERPRCR
jgi:hypothetical protein